MEWVLVFLMNGQIVKNHPTVAEACFLEMITRANQQAYCINSSGVSVRPNPPYSSDSLLNARMLALRSRH